MDSGNVKVNVNRKSEEKDRKFDEALHVINERLLRELANIRAQNLECIRQLERSKSLEDRDIASCQNLINALKAQRDKDQEQINDAKIIISVVDAVEANLGIIETR